MIFARVPLQTREKFTDGEVCGDVEWRVVFAPFCQFFLALHVSQLAKHHLVHSQYTDRVVPICLRFCD